MKTFLSLSVRKFLKNVYPVPIRIIVPNRRAPFNLNFIELKNKEGIIQVSDVENDSPDFPLVAIFTDKVIIYSMKEERGRFEEHKCCHETMDSVDVLLAENKPNC